MSRYPATYNNKLLQVKNTYSRGGNLFNTKLFAGRTQALEPNDNISNQFKFSICIVFIVSLATAFIWNTLPSYKYLASYAQKSQIFVSATFIEK
jgi:hypothetical protein